MTILEHEWDRKSVEFPLNENSIVFDIGAYKGRWSIEIIKRYNCRLYAFEPQAWAHEVCRQALELYPRAHVFRHGLGVESGVFPMEEYETDGATFMVGRSERDQSGVGELVEIGSFLAKKRIRRIDLCMMNIEGYEYALIPHMLDLGIFDHMTYFMCQFHPFGEDGLAEMGKIRDSLYEKMDYRFDYQQVLTCWERKDR